MWWFSDLVYWTLLLIGIFIFRATGKSVYRFQKPFAGPKQVLDYLGRYTHRVAISNNRLLVLEDGRVSFHWRDYAAGSVLKTMTLEASEFMKRFLLHVLPKRFVRIRHYGLLSNRNRWVKILLSRISTKR